MLARALRRVTPSSSPSASRASRPRRCARSPRCVAGGRHAARDAHLAPRGGRQPRRLAGVAHACSCSTRCSARSAPRAARTPTPGTSSCRGRSHVPAPPGALERADLAARVPAGDERDVVPAAAPAQGRARPARRLLHAASTTRCGRTPTASPGSRCSTDEQLVGLHVALTPTWSETAFFADYVLPMGHASERHDIHSYETHDGQWVGFRQPVLRAARERLGEPMSRHARGEPRRGVGGERVLDRAVVAHRPRRRARHPPATSSRASTRARS